MNLAMGGSLGSTDDIPADLGYEMLIDYVRVYQGDWTAIPRPTLHRGRRGRRVLASEVYADLAAFDWYAWGAATYQGLSTAPTSTPAWTTSVSSRTRR